MQTNSHALINATIGRQLKRRGIDVDMPAMILGSLAPDVPLTILTFIFFAQNGMFNQGGINFGEAYDNLYFTDPVWIIGHSLFHSPPMITLWIALGWYFGLRKGSRWGRFLFWFGVSNAMHTALDIPTHHNDGPLLLFPFNWGLRFNSPLSYWHPDYYGQQFSIFELILNITLLGYWGRVWIRSFRNRRAKSKVAA